MIVPLPKDILWLGNKSFFSPSMTFHTANAIDVVSRLDRDETFDETAQNERRRLPFFCFWTRRVFKTLLVVLLVVLRESQDRSVVVLLTSCFA